ncbi:hypothetical protein, partial [uncultured Rikenella sp.]|uniref:hypothetical protein n=1 Tax=uncultured Rikenella sp. TaxID=368003 RepID=UPI0026075377
SQKVFLVLFVHKENSTLPNTYNKTYDFYKRFAFDRRVFTFHAPQNRQCTPYFLKRVSPPSLSVPGSPQDPLTRLQQKAVPHVIKRRTAFSVDPKTIIERDHK